MGTVYDLLYITKKDKLLYEKNPFKSRIGLLVELVLNELPPHLKKLKGFICPYLEPIEGFEDEFVQGFELVIKENRDIEQFVRSYIPFLIMKKKKWAHS